MPPLEMIHVIAAVPYCLICHLLITEQVEGLKEAVLAAYLYRSQLLYANAN